MRRFGPAPNEQTFSSVLHACAEYGQVKVALSLLEELRQSSIIRLTPSLYLPLLKACANVGNANTAHLLINNMKHDSLKLTTEHMNLYLLSLAKCKMQIRAVCVLREMIESQESQPDLITLNTVLSACANAGDFEGAQALLDQMKEGNFKCRVQGGNDPMKWKQTEIKPDVVSYNTVISCADPETALDLIQEMRLTRRNREGVILPNSVTYTNAIARCRKASTNDDPIVRKSALEIALVMLDLARDGTLDSNGRSVDLNVFVYSAAIWTAEAVGDYVTAIKLLREMKCSANNICYDGVISALSQRGLYREALYFYYEMQSLGLSSTWKTYQKLSFAIKNARDHELFTSPRKKSALLEGVLSAMVSAFVILHVGLGEPYIVSTS